MLCEGRGTSGGSRAGFPHAAHARCPPQKKRSIWLWGLKPRLPPAGPQVRCALAFHSIGPHPHMMSLRAFCALPFYFPGPRPHITTPTRCARALHFAKLRLPANGAHPLCVVSLFHKALPAHSDARALCAGITFCKIPPAHKRSLPAVRSSCFARGAARLAVAGQAFRAMKNACRSLWRTDAFGNAMRAQAMLRRRIFPTPGARPAPSSGPPASGPVQAARGSLIRTRRFARLEMRPASPLCLSAARPPRYSCGVWGQAAKARPAPSRAGSM